jgi:hypothetical protein
LESLVLYPGVVGMHIQDAIMVGPDALILTFKVLLTYSGEKCQQILSIQQLFYVSRFTWVTTTTLTKISILHFYRSIFQKDRMSYTTINYYEYTAKAIYGATVLFWVIHIIMGFAECRPLAKEWDKTLSGSCLDTTKQELADTIINAILDFSIMVLPLPVLWSLNLPLKKKLGITGILCFALV